MIETGAQGIMLALDAQFNQTILVQRRQSRYALALQLSLLGSPWKSSEGTMARSW
jgi:hypothetical protein